MDPKWKTWKEHSNHQSTDGLHESLFDYNEDVLPKTQVFPDTTYQENPKKD